MKNTKTTIAILLAFSVICTVCPMEKDLGTAEQVTDNLEQLNADLFRAIENDNLNLVEKLINSGADVNAESDEDRILGPGVQAQPIHIAALEEQQRIVEWLAQHGASINAQDGEGKRLMHYAAWNGDLALATWLIDNERSERRSMLRLLHRNNIDIEAKLDKSSNMSAGVNAKDRQGIQPIHVTAMRGGNRDIAMAQWLINHGADRNAKDNRGRQPINYALLSGNWDLIEWFITQGVTINVNIADERGMQLIHITAKQGDQAKVQWLIEHGADSNAPDDNGNQAIHYSLFSDNLDLIKMLAARHVTPIDVNISYGNFYNHRNRIATLYKRFNRLPIHSASERGNVALVQWLIAHGGRINAKDGVGTRPIHDAASSCSVPVVALLVKKGVDINVPDAENRTPLQIVVGIQFVEGGETQVPMLEWLIAHGATLSADVDMMNADTDTETIERLGELLDPLLHALAFNDFQQAKALLFSFHFENVAPVLGKAIQVASGQGNSEFVQLVLEHYGKYIDEESLQKALECAASTGQLAIFKMLLAKANWNHDNFSNTLKECLLYAVAQGHGALIQHALEQENIKQHFDHRLLLYAFEKSVNLGRLNVIYHLYPALVENGDVEIGKELVNQETDNPQKPQTCSLSSFLSKALSVAVDRRRDEVVVFLLDRNLDTAYPLDLMVACDKLKVSLADVSLSEQRRQKYVRLRNLLRDYFVITKLIEPSRVFQLGTQREWVPVELLKYITHFLLFSYL